MARLDKFFYHACTKALESDTGIKMWANDSNSINRYSSIYCTLTLRTYSVPDSQDTNTSAL